jgi:hypothetical protein
LKEKKKVDKAENTQKTVTSDRDTSIVDGTIEKRTNVSLMQRLSVVQKHVTVESLA